MIYTYFRKSKKREGFKSLLKGGFISSYFMFIQEEKLKTK